MTKSASIEVQDFIHKVMALDKPKYQILEELRKIVFMNYPEVKERMMYGGIMFSLEDDFGGVFVYKNHVSFEFSYGYIFNDPDKLLEGNGKYRRHLKITSLDSMDMKQVDFFVKQATQVDD
ncbi:DUF1801 domain-containing protein [Fulvivirga sp. M361]|uniref:DUF1801 domain-containing protein n=1 Tax=Fulvivirga sp. M361 TaxID=2594266 RepID=UPI00117A6246|nr:DUF1801 domain-containing protein [Fulvivirga sp. M361]TRX48724.1 DUF1801 domain-containing protein [Fulvivirga sp. M361]